MKPIKVRPQFYSVCLLPLQEIAREHGYNLVVHGSMDRDLDLIAIPWNDIVFSELELVRAFDTYLNGSQFTGEFTAQAYLFSVLPGGRNAYVINLNRGGNWNNHYDEQFYLDISFTPFVAKQPSLKWT